MLRVLHILCCTETCYKYFTYFVVLKHHTVHGQKKNLEMFSNIITNNTEIKKKDDHQNLISNEFFSHKQNNILKTT